MKNLTMNVYELAEQGYVSEKWREISGLGTLSSEMCLWSFPHRSVPYVQASYERLSVQDIMKKASRCFFMDAPEDCRRPVDGWRLISIDRRETKKKTVIDLYCQSDRFGWRKIHCELTEFKRK